jgi:hypothetical protein
MVTETICLEILRLLFDHTGSMTRRIGTIEQTDTEPRSMSEGGLYRALLARYDLTDIESAIRWLEFGEYVGRTTLGQGGPWVFTLREKGASVLEAGKFPDTEQELLYRVDPHAVFLARQFNTPDAQLGSSVRKRFERAGFRVQEGKAEGLEQFRHAIVTKIRDSRFFLCLLTRRDELKKGGYTSSVWLYQEIGAAVAFGKRPLLLVEDGIDDHYAGELQKVYEYIPFNRSRTEEAIEEAVRRITADLEANNIALPKPSG